MQALRSYVRAWVGSFQGLLPLEFRVEGFAVVVLLVVEVNPQSLLVGPLVLLVWIGLVNGGGIEPLNGPMSETRTRDGKLETCATINGDLSLSSWWPVGNQLDTVNVPSASVIEPVLVVLEWCLVGQRVVELLWEEIPDWVMAVGWAVGEASLLLELLEEGTIRAGNEPGKVVGIIKSVVATT